LRRRDLSEVLLSQEAKAIISEIKKSVFNDERKKSIVFQSQIYMGKIT
jgi:hypothetical protein